PGSEDPDIPILAARYIRELKSIQPAGPYSFAGYCLGGLIVYEMAQQLRAAGDEVALACVMQAFTPEAHHARLRRPFLLRMGQLLLTRLEYEYNIQFRISREDYARLDRDRLERFR